ncbi:hypothetical protein [Glycocaulis alkaliphilus]|uniref:hypothetical protein n=1 Tax=Glycocaulis alkaliphilus TaxID=1434191 RepID=UPI000FDBC964|nr:hypothetical protein [Glycocaulis alkaliphilus]GGB67854.1 hypothetical protein GCM10007417_04630 [Glycocaulis alkaliphilus]
MKYSRENAALRFEGFLAGNDGEPTDEPAAVVIHLPDQASATNPAILVEVFRGDLTSPWTTKRICGEHTLQSLSMALRFSEALIATFR